MKARFVILSLIAVPFIFPTTASAQDGKETLDALLAVSSEDVVVLSDNLAGYPSGVLEIGLEAASDDDVANAQGWLEQFGGAFGIQSPGEELVVGEVRTTARRTLVRFDQVIGEIPVFRGEFIVVLELDGQLRSFINGYMPLDGLLREQTTVPSVDADWALQQAVKDGEGVLALTGDTIDEVDSGRLTRLVFVSPTGSHPSLAWEVHPQGLFLAYNYRFFYDALTGDRLLLFNDIRFEDRANVFEPSPGYSESNETIEVVLPDRTDPDGYLTGSLVLARNCPDQGETLDLDPFVVPICSEVQVAQTDEDGDFLYEPDFDNTPDDLFAETHMYYHVYAIYQYMQGLGLDTVEAVPLTATVNFRMPGMIVGGDGLVPFDNAFFFPAGDIMGIYERPFDSIVFGQGENVDYAYDGDVIYHEFGHAVFNVQSSPGDITVDEQGLSTAPAALNEGWADFVAGAFTGDPQIGEYVGPRIPQSSGARNIRTMDNDDVCPNDLFGEVHLDSTHFTGALWEIRVAYVDELSGNPIDFDSTVFDAIGQWTSMVSFTDAATILSTELTDLDPNLAPHLETAWTAHNVIDCERVITLGSGINRIAQALYGPEMIGFDPFVPGYVQYHVEITEEDLPANNLSLSFDYQGGGFGGFSVPVRPGFLISIDEPVEFYYQGNTVQGNWTEQLDSYQTEPGHRRAELSVEEGLVVGDYYFMPVGTHGGEGVMANFVVDVAFEEPQPDPEPQPEQVPDAGQADLDVGLDGGADGVAETDAAETTPTDTDDDGCGCMSSTRSRRSAYLGGIFIVLIGILRARKRLCLTEA